MAKLSLDAIFEWRKPQWSEAYHETVRFSSLSCARCHSR